MSPFVHLALLVRLVWVGGEGDLVTLLQRDRVVRPPTEELVLLIWRVLV